MSTVLFIRHGATKGNLERRYIGKTDEPLCDVGIRQAIMLRQHHFTADCLFVSPMLRTKQTAELIFPQMPYTVTDDFAETDFGIFEGKTADELASSEAYRNWVASDCRLPIPDGENVTDFKNRCKRAFLSVMQKVPEEAHAVFVLHGGVIMAILEAYEQSAHNFYDYHLENGAYPKYRFFDGSLIPET